MIIDNRVRSRTVEIDFKTKGNEIDLDDKINKFIKSIQKSSDIFDMELSDVDILITIK